MRSIPKIGFGVVFVLVVFAMGAFAQSRPRSINHREHRQVHRIRQGVHSGELTRRETKRVVREQAHLRGMEYRFRHTGDGLSPRERVRLQRELNQSSRMIYRQKHDNQDRPGPQNP